VLFIHFYLNVSAQIFFCLFEVFKNVIHVIRRGSAHFHIFQAHDDVLYRWAYFNTWRFEIFGALQSALRFQIIRYHPSARVIRVLYILRIITSANETKSLGYRSRRSYTCASVRLLFWWDRDGKTMTVKTVTRVKLLYFSKHSETHARDVYASVHSAVTLRNGM